MKQIILVLGFVISCFMNCMAQPMQVASLNHEGNIKFYYGSKAFINAEKAAVDGDIITLSPGNFETTQNYTMYKGLTIRGAGWKYEDSAYEKRSIIGTLQFNINGKDASVILEGLCCGGVTISSDKSTNLVQIKKCYIGGRLSASQVNLQFIKGYIYNLGSAIGTYSNSIIDGIDNSPSNLGNRYFLNCLVRPYYPGYSSTLRYSELTNCIIIAGGMSNFRLDSSNKCYNCLGVDSNGQNPYLLSNWSNQYYTDESLFAGPFANGTLSPNTYDFVLTDEAKTKYLGEDGTEVGIYGGLFPFESSSDFPQITKFNVAKKTTTDGKLSVDIEIKLPEKQ